eukprot:2947198-Prymnesium_polylepis.1
MGPQQQHYVAADDQRWQSELVGVADTDEHPPWGLMRAEAKAGCEVRGLSVGRFVTSGAHAGTVHHVTHVVRYAHMHKGPFHSHEESRTNYLHRSGVLH